MYEYKFEKIELWTKAKGKEPKEDYHEIIHQYARDGWRLVQIFAPPSTTMGMVSYFELIFEREAE